MSFSVNRQTIAAVTARCSYGGMGSYHDTFTHYKSMIDKKTWPDLPMRYRPYPPCHDKLVRMFLK